VGFSVAYGALHWVGATPTVVLPAAQAALPQADPQAVVRALGGDQPTAQVIAAAAPEMAARYQLVGVVAEKGGAGSGGGVALIATDGQRPLPYPVGTRVDGRWVVHQVTSQTAVLRPFAATGAAQSGDPMAGLTLRLAKP
jgi:general secretion pathway protein C